jgi:putative membrane protein
MKKIIAIVATGLAIGSFAACHNASPNSVNNADSTNKADISSGATAVDKSSTDFAVNAANGGMMEVEMGKVAEHNGYSRRVREFGRMMREDHTNLNNRMKEIASTQNITLPDSVSTSDRKKIDDMKTKSGKDFDKAYIDMMVSDHKSDISDFQKAANNLQDTVLSSFASQALPTLQKHLDSAQAIQQGQ